MPSREAELPMNGAAPGIGASTLSCEPTLLLRAALFRRLLSVSLGGSRRALTYRVLPATLSSRSLSERVFPTARLYVCASSHARPRRRRYLTRRNTCNREGICAKRNT